MTIFSLQAAIATVALSALCSEVSVLAQSGGVNCTIACTASLSDSATGQIPAGVHFFIEPGNQSSTVGQSPCQRCLTNPEPCRYETFTLQWTGNSDHDLEVGRPGGSVIVPDEYERPGKLATHCGATPDFVNFTIWYTQSSPHTNVFTRSLSLACGC